MSYFDPFRIFQFYELEIKIRGRTVATVSGEATVELGNAYMPIFSEITLYDLDEAHVTLSDDDGFEGLLRHAVNIALHQQRAEQIGELANELRREYDRHEQAGNYASGSLMAGM